MNENGSKRRDWVKNAAIIFLTIMLLLTFFSNTIMNYSLPEVAVQYVQSGSITTKIRGTGTVESDDPYEVNVKETRKVDSVLVREGDSVQKGDPLFLLADVESTELQAAKDAAKAAQNALDVAVTSLELAILKGDISNATANNIQNGNVMSFANYQKRMESANADVEKLEKGVEDANATIARLESQQGSLAGSTPDTGKEQEAFNAAQNALNADPVKKAYDKIQDYAGKIAECDAVIAERQEGIVTGYITVSSGDLVPILSVSDEEYQIALVNRARYIELMGKEQETVAVPEAKAEYDRLLKVYNDAQAALESKQNSVTNGTNAIAAELNKQRALLADTTAKLTAAQDVRADLLTEIEMELTGGTSLTGGSSIKDLREALVKAQEAVLKEEEKSVGTTIEAPISGTISSINVVSGRETDPTTPAITMLPEGSKFSMSFKVTNDQARRLSPGMQAELVNSWRYDDVVVTLSAIRPDPENPSQQKLAVFDVTGSVTDGQSISVSVGDRSANYEMIVPNSAVREDSNGKFVLMVESRPSPLSTRYIATRVDVEVVASDDTQSAITGGLYTYSYVITTSTAPVVAGQQVRLADN